MAIVGGTSGVLMAAHLLARSEADVRVTILEGRNMLGCGIAYSTQDGTVEIPALRAIDCRGIRRDPLRHGSPLVRDMLARGQVRLDPLQVGLDVAPDCTVLDAQGSRIEGLFAIGPASRAAFWEITAISDIREQAAGLAARLHA